MLEASFSYLYLGHLMLVGKALSFTSGLYSFFFYQSTVLSSHAEDAHQMYFGGLVVNNWYSDLPTFPLIFIGAKE